MLNKVAAAALSLSFGSLSLAGASAVRYAVTNLNPGPVAIALGINESGHVVGYYLPTGSSADGSHGFLYKDGVVTDIPPVSGGLNCQATAINDNDVVVGWSAVSTPDFQKMFTFINGTLTLRGTLGGNWSEAYGINNDGYVVGYSRIAGNTATHAFRYSIANMSISNTDDLGTLGGANSFANAINATGIIVGTSSLTGDTKQHAASWNFIGGPVDLGALPGADNSYLFAISDNFTAVGFSNTSGNGGQHAVAVDSLGTMTDLGALSSTDFSQANGVNDSGQIVGWSASVSGGGRRHAFLYSGGVMHDLNDLIDPGSGMVIAEANAINGSGQIAGTAYNPSFTAAYAVLLTPHVIQAPTVAISGKSKIKTKKNKLTIKGSASGEVSSVTWQIGRKPSQTAAGTSVWSLRTPKLKHGRNVVTVIAHGYGGSSSPARVTIVHS